MTQTMAKCDVVYKSDNYLIRDFDYDTQYYPYYKSRLDAMKPKLRDSVGHKWGSNMKVLCLHELAEHNESIKADTEFKMEEKVVVVGTLFKRSPLQPSILKELSEDKPVLGDPMPDKFISDEDTLWLQSGDETIQVVDLPVNEYCTGVCVAILGSEDFVRSVFVGQDVCFAADWSPVVSIDRPVGLKDQYIAVVSGLGFSKFMNTNKQLTKALNVLMDVLKGNSPFAQNKSICRLIIAGNGIGLDARQQECDSLIDVVLPVWTQKARAQTLEAIILFDTFMARLGQCIEIDVMPGDLDPTSQLWPQQPMHPCIFKKAYQLSSIKCVSNPHLALYNGMEVLCTSGQNIDSIRQYTKMNDSIDIMRKTLDWMHLAPTCPDTMLCYPFKDTDPFMLTHYPDVYLVGNQKEFNTGTYTAPNGKQVLLVSVPIFEQKMICCLINTSSFKCDIIALN